MRLYAKSSTCGVKDKARPMMSVKECDNLKTAYREFMSKRNRFPKYKHGGWHDSKSKCSESPESVR